MMGFAGGVLLFSFSLYALVLTDITRLAMITPVGGLLLMLSWLMVAIKALKPRRIEPEITRALFGITVLAVQLRSSKVCGCHRQ